MEKGEEVEEGEEVEKGEEVEEGEEGGRRIGGRGRRK